MDALRSTFAAGKEVAEGHALQRNPESKSSLGAIQSPVVEGVDAAISLLVAEERSPDPVRNYRRLRENCVRTWRGPPRLRDWATGDI